MRVRKKQCPTCVFKTEAEGGCPLDPGRREQINEQVLAGVNQICHHDDNKTICRGGRDYQLQIWCRLGLIPEATDDALRAAMEQLGIKPGSHV